MKDLIQVCHPRKGLSRIKSVQHRAEEAARVAEQKAIYVEQQADGADQRVVQADYKAELLAAKLRELGIDPNALT